MSQYDPKFDTKINVSHNDFISCFTDFEETLYLWIMSQNDSKLVRFYIGIYFRVSFGGHNLGIFYAWQLEFGMLFTQT